MLKRSIKTIHRLRVYLLIFITVAFFYYLGTNPIQVGRYVGARFGSAVGMSTSVPENPFNKLALDLQEKEDQLALRERELSERERRLSESGNQGYLLAGMGIGICILFLLIALNYYLDFRRKKMTGGKAYPAVKPER